MTTPPSKAEAILLDQIAALEAQIKEMAALLQASGKDPDSASGGAVRVNQALGRSGTASGGSGDGAAHSLKAAAKRSRLIAEIDQIRHKNEQTIARLRQLQRASN